MARPLTFKASEAVRIMTVNARSENSLPTAVRILIASYILRLGVWVGGFGDFDFRWD